MTYSLSELTPALCRWLKLCTGLVLVLSLIPFVSLSLAGHFAYLAELAAHFRVQYLIFSLFAVIGWLYFRQRRWLVLSLLPLCLNGAYVARMFQTEPAAQIEAATSMRLMLANVRTDNRSFSKLIQRVDEHQPDVLFLQEVDTEWLAALIPLRERYPYITSEPRGDNFGIAVFSRWPAQTQVLHTASQVPSLYTRVTRAGQALHIVSTHPLPPVSLSAFEERNLQLTEIASLMLSLPEPKVLIGDLNLTMWSPFFTLLQARTGLRDARQGFGVVPSWPVPQAYLDWIRTPLLMIPLDHCLVSEDVTVVNVESTEEIGSDHLPLLVDLTW